MDIQLLPEAGLASHGGFPIPCGTTAPTIEKLRSLCADGNLQDFETAMDSETFDIADLHDVMMEAIQLDRVEFVSTLIFHGFLIKPSYTEKPYYAVTDADMTSWFLEHGANPNAQCEVDCTPLSYAVRNAHPSVIKLLLDSGGDVQKGQLLQYAVLRDGELEEVISLLVERGAPLNATMFQDGPTLRRFFPMSLGTALHVATEQGKTNAIRLLIQLGIDTGVKDANGDTALEWAQKWNKTEMAQLLTYLQDYQLQGMKMLMACLVRLFPYRFLENRKEVIAENFEAEYE
ncbi:ankyrin [Aspergillus steynii IBT 23096]|uniref:Ankyrin n=1 Tax=Aspergillus steynii IBT 23096 TaxID=1392250 RepID=A0A2I2G469_9EURO|nr:ankyrin [Aspergillus steynii IBT 23096]PLB47668.1 ankyrin [Aspergillus steynii IBT 23096]